MSESISNVTTRRVQDWGHILAALHSEVHRKIHIAGGAVRDTILGRPIRDIDIFLDDFLGDGDCDKAAALLRSRFGYVKVGEWKTYEGFSDPMVTRVAKFEKADDTIPICLIGLGRDCTGNRLTVQGNIKRFDFGVCMAAWTGGEEMITTDQLKRDIESQTFTLTRADNYAQFAYSMVRYEKLAKDRYAGWTLSVPDGFEELVREHTFRQHWYREDCGRHFGMEDGPSQVLRPKER